MKLTAAQLRSIIKEETKRALSEAGVTAGGPGPEALIYRSVEALEKVAIDLDKALATYPQSENYNSENAKALQGILAQVDDLAASLSDLVDMSEG